MQAVHTDTNVPASPTQPPLAGVLTRSTTGPLAANTYRRYAGGIKSTALLRGQKDQSQKTIVYEVGARHKTAAAAWARVGEDVPLISQDVRNAETVAASLFGIAKKHSNFTGMYDFMDLSSMIEILSRGLAYFANTGTLTCTNLRRGHPVRVVSLNVSVDPITCSRTSVFIGRTNSMQLYPGAFYALTAAANGSGSTVYTDVVEVDGNNAVVLHEPAGVALANACYGALRIILSMYDAALQGSTAAYAVTKGIHSTVSVVGHTDEGGLMRDALRLNGFAPSYGGIYFDLASTYVGLPAPNVTSVASFEALVDAIALVTAGAVALCEPGVVLDGRVYPTTFTHVLGVAPDNETPEAEAARIAAHVADLTAQIAVGCGRFVSLYTRVLGQIFYMQDDSRIADGHLQQCIETLTQATINRHLMNDNVCPWYWIEPTSLFRHDFGSYCRIGPLGLVAPVAGEQSMPTFEGDIIVIGTSGMNHTSLSIGWSTARASGLALHLNGHLLNGTAHIVPFQFVADKVLGKGGANDPAAARTAGVGLNDYLWTRGQSPLCAPGEFNYIGTSMGVRYITGEFNPDTYTDTVNHVPNVAELGEDVIFTAFSPRSIANGASNAPPRVVRRLRNMASQALTAAMNRTYGGLATGGELIATGDHEPLAMSAAASIGHIVNREIIAGVDLLESQVKTGRVMFTYLQDKARVQRQTGPTNRGAAATPRPPPNVNGRGNRDQPVEPIVPAEDPHAESPDLRDMGVEGQAEGPEVPPAPSAAN